MTADPDVPDGTVVTVVPDVRGVDRSFDYAVPELLAPGIAVGTLVRVPLQGRRVRGWVVEIGSTSTVSVPLKEIFEIVSVGPSPDVVRAARFGAWRYAGPVRPFLVTASPPRLVRRLPAPGVKNRAVLGLPAEPGGLAPVASAEVAAPEMPATEFAAAGKAVALVGTEIAAAVREALSHARSVLRLPPAARRLEAVVAALDQLGAAPDGGDVLVLVPERSGAETLVRLLRRAGRHVALYPDEWPEAAAGGRVVVGSRAAALATVPRLAGVVVLDAHAEAYVEQRAPTWHAAVLAAERARLVGVPCMLVSACPTVEQLAWGSLVTLPRGAERAGWPPLEVIDRREEDPRSGLYSPRLAPLLAFALDSWPSLPAICVLNRKGRARLLACGACGAVVRCERCGAAMSQSRRPLNGEATQLDCARCGTIQPGLCTGCGSTRLKVLRVGVARAAEELAALTGRAVVEVSGAAGREKRAIAETGLVVGTEAVLHRVRAASVVVFLDLDQELLATRFRAPEEALALLARAARLVGAAGAAGGGGAAGAAGGGATGADGAVGSARRAAGGRATARVVVQTRLPDHDVVVAALRGDPAVLASAEAARRAELGLPPNRALAELSGAGATALVDALRTAPIDEGTVEVADLGDGRYLVRARDAAALADALRGAGPLLSRVRVDVDPLGA